MSWSKAALLAAVLALAAGGAARAADPYDVTVTLALGHERRGELDLAARALEEALPRYPQDYALLVHLAWVRTRMGDHATAERHYRAALALSPGAPDAVLGLGWSLARQGRCDEAHLHLAAALAMAAMEKDARAGLAHCAAPPAWRITPSFTWIGRTAGTGERAYAAGGDAGLGFLHRSGWFLAARYRYLRYGLSSSTPDGAGQQEVYVETGIGRSGGGIAAQYAAVHDGTSTSHHVGLSARWSPWGDGVVDAALSVYDDLTVLRVEPSWRLPLGAGLGLRLAVAVQRAGAETLVSGSATLALDRAAGGLWVGGKYGAELRPAYLASHAVLNLLDRIDGGLSAGAYVNLGRGWRLRAAYQLDRLVPDSGDPGYAHTVTAGAAFSF